MRRNNACNCGCSNVQSCTCKISTTTSNCNSVCNPPIHIPSSACVLVPTVPNIPTNDANPTVTIESLLTLIEVKCDKVTCTKLQSEIDALYGLLKAVKPIPVSPAVSGTKTGRSVTPIAIPPVAFQLIADMTESLSGDLTNKYPSAHMLKAELTKLWKCIAEDHKHHGKWLDNFTYRDILHQAGDECVTSLSPTAPNTIKVITPVDIGSTVFHTIEGRECLFESLVDNNIVEPSKISVLDGRWLNYCDLRDVIDSVLPRTKITDCHQACDDPNQDGVFEDRTMSERVACIETQICDTECVAGVPTICERTTLLEACVLPVGDATLCQRVTSLEVKGCCILSATRNTDNSIDLHKKDGTVLHIPEASVEDNFIRDMSGVDIHFFDDPNVIGEISAANVHFKGTYPDDLTGFTAQSVIDTGLAPVDAADPTATEWFAVSYFNNGCVDNALAFVQGVFATIETGFTERPLAYTDNVSRTAIEVVALNAYEHAVDAHPVVPGATNPYAGVHEYVTAQVQKIRAQGLNTNTGTQITALPRWEQENGGIRDKYIKTVCFGVNDWMSRVQLQPVMLFMRFKNYSAVNSTAISANIDNPSYTPGAMTPQPIAQYNNAFVKRISGVYKYRKVLPVLVP